MRLIEGLMCPTCAQRAGCDRSVDYATWRKGYDDFDDERRSMGVTGDAVYRSIDDGNDVTVWHDF